jgi:hypothetical protein
MAIRELLMSFLSQSAYIHIKVKTDILIFPFFGWFNEAEQVAADKICIKIRKKSVQLQPHPPRGEPGWPCSSRKNVARVLKRS